MSESAPVAIICATYNQGRFIKDALDGFVMQETSFPFKVFVGDDCSQDDTRSIVNYYASKYPGTIVPILREKNIGAGKNLVDLISRTSARYIAFCEGDDYWTDRSKLQKQYDLMESEKSLRACFHDVRISVETPSGHWFQESSWNNTDNGELRWPSGNKRFPKKDIFKIENYIPFGFVHTSSMFVRWSYDIGFPEWFYGHGMSDYPLWVLQVGEGLFKYIPEVMSTHRRTNEGNYNFDNTAEFWLNSKPGWVTLDEALIRHYSGKTRPSIIRALKARKADDLAKLIKGSMMLNSKEETWQVLYEFSESIHKSFGIVVPSQYDELAYDAVIRQLSNRAPLPPYNNSLEAKIRRFIKQKLETARIRTLWPKPS